MEDSKIVDLYWQRSELAIPETERKYGSYCHKIALNICGSREDAEECVNDTWLRAWNRMPDERPGILSAFLGTITRNFAIDRYRLYSCKKRGGGETELALDELGECVPSQLDVEKTLEEHELEETVRKFVLSLNETERNVFLSRYWYLASIAEISQRLHCSESRTKSMLFRLRKKLSVWLEDIQ